MSQAQTTSDVAKLSVQNIGGISETEVTFSPGVTILSGRNASNRTSLLQGIMAALGSDRVSLKGDAQDGEAKLTIAGETFTRSLKRRDGDVVMNGDPYLDDSRAADLFAFLTSSNEARRAVENDADLRDLIMRPIDTEEIEAEIGRLKARRREIDTELDELASLEQRLPELEEKRERLDDEIEQKRRELEETEERIGEADRDVESTKKEKQKLEDRLEALNEVRSEYKEAQRELESQRERVAALESELEELKDERRELPDVSQYTLENLSDQIGQLRARQKSLNSTVTELQTIIQFNEDMVEDSDGVAVLEDGTEAQPVTSKLESDQSSVTCWTCGSKVEKRKIEDTLDRLRELRKEKLEERNEVQSELEELKAEKKTQEKKKHQRERIGSRIEQTVSELERRRDRVQELEDRPKELENRLDELEEEIERFREESNEEILDLHKQANQLEFEIGRLVDDREDVSSEIDELKEELDRRDELQEERASIKEQLEDLRTRIDQIETEAVDQFNDHMETVLDILEYENIERVWIEQKKKEVREGRRKVEKSIFDLHVVRNPESGAAYEDELAHLSESEREITGFVFAFAGYLTHDLHEEIPFLLLDSLEAIDSERIAAFVEYVDNYADHTVVALLPEDAQATADDYQYIHSI